MCIRDSYATSSFNRSGCVILLRVPYQSVDLHHSNIALSGKTGLSVEVRPPIVELLLSQFGPSFVWLPHASKSLPHSGCYFWRIQVPKDFVPVQKLYPDLLAFLNHCTVHTIVVRTFMSPTTGFDRNQWFSKGQLTVLSVNNYSSKTRVRDIM